MFCFSINAFAAKLCWHLLWALRCTCRDFFETGGVGSELILKYLVVFERFVNLSQTDSDFLHCQKQYIPEGGLREYVDVSAFMLRRNSFQCRKLTSIILNDSVILSVDTRSAYVYAR